MPRSVRFDNGKALVPLGLIAERWIRDYWQLASGPRMPRQIHQNRELGFGTALERTMTKCHSQYGVFESLMRNEARSKDQTSLLQLLFDDVVTTALKGPIHYIQDDGRNPVFTYVATHELAAMTPKSMSAWLVGAGELVKRRRIGYEDLLSRTTFTNNSQRDLVEYVLAGRERVGLLPACALEQLALDPSFPMDEIEVLNPKKKDGLSCVHSTEVYPGRVFAAVNDIDPTLKKAMTAVLLGMSSIKYGAEWALPVTNRPVFDLFYTLKIGPYSDLAGWSFQRFVREHAEIIALIMLVIFLVLTYTTTLSILVRRRTRALRDALGQRDRIEAEAAQSRQHIANLERTGIVGQMSTIIAHELKQPLAVIRNYARGLSRTMAHGGSTDPEVFRTVLAKIDSQSTKASDIIDHVRSFARQPAQPVPTSLSDLAEKAIAQFCATRGLEVSRRIEPGVTILADALEMELLISNLLKNAADATAGTDDAVIRASLSAEDGTAMLTISDNGPRLTDEQFARLTIPLNTSKPQGLGLGLVIVRRIAESARGRVLFERLPERGLAITVSLPVCEQNNRT